MTASGLAVRQMQRSLIWRRLDTFGADYCVLWREATGWSLEGSVLLPLDRRPLQVHYRVLCDTAWRTRAATTTLMLGSTERSQQLVLDEQQRWWLAGQELTALQGCQDLDLDITPATNTLPIRRLDLGIGKSADLEVVWVRFPELTLERLRQRYTRLAEQRYRYESHQGSFDITLEVDELGLVTSYPGGWERIAVA